MGNQVSQESEFYGQVKKTQQYFQKVLYFPSENQQLYQTIINQIQKINQIRNPQIIKIIDYDTQKVNMYCNQIFQITIKLETVLYSLAQQIKFRKQKVQIIQKETNIPEKMIFEIAFCLICGCNGLLQSNIPLDGLDTQMIGRTYDSYKIAIPRFLVKKNTGKLYRYDECKYKNNPQRAYQYIIGLICLQSCIRQKALFVRVRQIYSIKVFNLLDYLLGDYQMISNLDLIEFISDEQQTQLKIKKDNLTQNTQQGMNKSRNQNRLYFIDEIYDPINLENYIVRQKKQSIKFEQYKRKTKENKQMNQNKQVKKEGIKPQWRRFW